MKNRVVLASLSLAVVLFVHGSLPAQAPFRSGHQPGDKILSEFECLNINGAFAGKQHCLVCENGLNPVAMVFARRVDEPLVRLLVQLEAAAEKHRAHELGSFVVFLSDDAGLAKQLKQVAEKNKLKHTVLSIYRPAGPEGFYVSKTADVTVVMYHKFLVAANHAFKKGELTDKASARIVADVPKILPKK